MATPPDVEVVLVDAWDLRCIFNHSRLVARVKSGELVSALKYPRKKPGPKRRQDPPGTVNQAFIYSDHHGNEVASVHYWHLNGVPVSPVDPKAIRIGPKRFVIFPDDETANPEKKWFMSVIGRKAYGFFRKMKCFVFGPLATVPFVVVAAESKAPIFGKAGTTGWQSA